MPTIITKTIGPGRDYTTFAAAEAAVATIPTTDDMVANDEAIVFEVDAGTYTENVTFDSSTPGPGLTMDATRNITYRPAAGSEHGGDKDAGVIIDGGAGIACNVRENHLVLEGLSVKSDSSAVYFGGTYAGRVLDGAITSPSTGGGAAQGVTQIRDGGDQTTIKNCVLNNTGSWAVNFNPTTINGSNSCDIVNCTFYAATAAILDQPSVAATLNVTNCAFLTGDAMSIAAPVNTTRTGSGNVTSTALTQTSLLALSQTWTFTTDPLAASTGSQVIYDATTGAMVRAAGNDALGVGTATGAPATDILGVDRIRGIYADPGAFDAAGTLITLTKTIKGAGGGDYTTFTAAEAAVSTIPSGSNLVQRGEAIVFEADAGTYSESVTFDSSTPGPGLTMDATRNITYRPAAGSEHGGSLFSGVRLGVGAQTQTVKDGHTTLSGLSIEMGATTNNPTVVVRSGLGATVENCLLYSNGGREVLRAGVGASADIGSAAAPLKIVNCVFHTGAGFSYPYAIALHSSGYATYADLANCTIATSPASASYFIFLQKGTPALEVNFVNCLSVAAKTYANAGGTVTGSNNVGGSTNPWPVALQALSQTWTTTTDPLAASTGSQVIYDATSGAMVDAAGNDAWQILTDLSVAPTTDIEGVTREATGYNPGAFERTAADVGTPIGGGVDYLRDLNIRDRFLRGAAIREPFIRNLR